MRWDYLNEVDSPFLLKLAKEGIYSKKLRPSLGFCERVEMFSGAKPDASGLFTALTFDRSKSDFNKMSSLEYAVLAVLCKTSEAFGKLNPFTMSLFKHGLINRIYLKKILGSSQPIYDIPLEFIREISLTEDYVDMCNKDSLSVETIFDIMMTERRSFLYDTFASLRLDIGHSDGGRIKKMMSLVQNHNYDLNLLYLGKGDAIGHIYGPSSNERRQMVKRLDDEIRFITAFFHKKYKEVDLLLIGDHGMIDVRKYVNAYDKILLTAREKGLEVIRDYRFFIDSTMIRLWLHTQKAIHVFENLFETDFELTNFGRIITDIDKSQFHLPPNLSYYGDLIWLAEPGVVLFPDFFHKTMKVRGMHGYDPSVEEQKGFAILHSKTSRHAVHFDERELVDICPTLCDLLDIRYPKSNCGKSLV